MGERGVGWSTLGYLIQVGMRGNAAGPVCPGHIHETRTKVCHYAPSSEGALRRGENLVEWGPAVGPCLGKYGGNGEPGGDKAVLSLRACGRHLGTGYPDGSSKGEPSEPRKYASPETP